ncbi:endonuclease [Enterococcus faecalis]|uniref:endonuclease/exonuclease/phosphatase family protein n=1 Tax=Enterococcus TaxID=1350 RepID=UPI001112655E|nr:endonuclease/exonuclease/phosphatase family protein [Enterococcus faecalis]EGO8211592.1 endonuclease [Enterococcus faecalis]EHV2680157.1 endonuclease [Enterococcus faecalis]MBD9772099.1 endonuclease [Enterococcus faecalis]MBD9790260.1 endonuclease [Enterococcus faecalis]MBD9796055.1 endonuclease [Enterococcus faecalis]
MEIKQKHIFFVILSTVLMIGGCMLNKKDIDDSRQSRKDNELVVATFNIDIKAPGVKVEDQRKLLSDKGVEIFGIQEVIQNTKRYAEREDYDPLEDFQMQPYEFSFFGKSVDFASGGYGNAIISKYQLKDESVVPLYSAEEVPLVIQTEFLEVYKSVNYRDQESVDAFKSAWGADGLVAKGAIEPRSYSRVVINKEGKNIAFYVTHLSVESVDVRKKQFQQLKKALDSDTTTYKILVGDFNADDGINEYDIFNEGYKMANGYEGVWLETMAEEDFARKAVDSDLRVKFLDNVIVSDNIEIKKVETLKTNLSDHLPLVVRLELK